MSRSDDPAQPVVDRVAALGGGLIGRSWTALFLAAGKSVALFDPDPVRMAGMLASGIDLDSGMRSYAERSAGRDREVG